MTLGTSPKELPTTKICHTCGKPKLLNQFFKTRRGGRQTYYNDCIDCVNSRKRATSRGGSKFLFPTRCGGCGKRITNPSQQRGFLCIDCARPGKDRASRVKKYESTLGARPIAYSCPSCAFVDVCNVRIKAGLWMVCEMPDQHDLERAALHGIQTDGRQITLRKDQVRQPDVWPGWWPDEVEIGEGQPLTMERVNNGK